MLKQRKMKNFNLTNLLYNLLITLLIAFAGTPLIGPSSLAIAALMFIYGLMPIKMMPNGTFRNEVIKRVFSADLQEFLFPNNAFYKGANVDTGVADTAESVEVPQDEDGESEYVVNPTKFPLETVEEDDNKKEYSLDLVATKPQRIGDVNQALLSYDKRSSKLRKHANTLNTQSASRILQAWQPTVADFKRVTTGSTARPAKAPGASGNRKRIAKADVFHFFSMFNDLDIPTNGDGAGERRLVIPAYMYEDLLTIDEFINSEKLRMRGDLNAGQIGEILGFKVYMRSRGAIYAPDTVPVLKPIGAASGSTDLQSALFFHTGFVRYAEGLNRLYINPDRGEFLGTTMNAALRTGGMISRLSQKGVGVLVEDNA